MLSEGRIYFNLHIFVDEIRRTQNVTQDRSFYLTNRAIIVLEDRYNPPGAAAVKHDPPKGLESQRALTDMLINVRRLIITNVRRALTNYRVFTPIVYACEGREN